MGWDPQKIKCTHKIKCWGLTPFYFQIWLIFFLKGVLTPHSLEVHHRRIVITVISMFQTRAWKLTQPWALPTWTYSSYHIQSESIQYALVHFAVCYKVAKQVFVESKPETFFFFVQIVKTLKVTKPFLSPQALSLLVEPGILTCAATNKEEMQCLSCQIYMCHLLHTVNYQNAVWLISVYSGKAWCPLVSPRALDHNGFRSAWCNLAGTTARPNIHALNYRAPRSCLFDYAWLAHVPMIDFKSSCPSWAVKPLGDCNKSGMDTVLFNATTWKCLRVGSECLACLVLRKNV